MVQTNLRGRKIRELLLKEKEGKGKKESSM